MYAWPIALPITTNREDLTLSLSLFDDDTGEAIDLSGRTLGVPGDFTGAAWIVTSGSVVTASASQLTIKDYPINAEMQALPLIVGQGLGILAGDPVTIADATGLNTMTGFVTSYVAATGAMVCRIGVAFDFEIMGGYQGCDGGYGPNWAVSSAYEQPLIRAQLGSGVSLVDVGVAQVAIPASVMAQLTHRTYSAALAVQLGGETRQLFVAQLPIISGGLRSQPFSP